MKQTIINMTRIWNIFIDHSYGKYGKRNEIIYNTDVLRSNLCDYNNAYILVRGEIAVAVAPATQIVLQKLMKQQ